MFDPGVCREHVCFDRDSTLNPSFIGQFRFRRRKNKRLQFLAFPVC